MLQEQENKPWDYKEKKQGKEPTRSGPVHAIIIDVNHDFVILRGGLMCLSINQVLRVYTLLAKDKHHSLLSNNDPAMAFNWAEYKHPGWNSARTLHLTFYSK